MHSLKHTQKHAQSTKQNTSRTMHSLKPNKNMHKAQNDIYTPKTIQSPKHTKTCTKQETMSSPKHTQKDDQSTKQKITA